MEEEYEFIFNTRNVFSSPSTPHVDKHPVTSAQERGKPPGGTHPSHVLHKKKLRATPDPDLTGHATLTCPFSALRHIKIPRPEGAGLSGGGCPFPRQHQAPVSPGGTHPRPQRSGSGSWAASGDQHRDRRYPQRERAQQGQG